MAVPLLYAWWHSSRDPVDSVDFDPEEEVQCDGEAEDEICWFLGEIILLYCLTVAIIKIIYLAVDKIFKKQDGGGSSWCRWLKDSKICQDCGCECHCKFNICGLVKKVVGGKPAVQKKSPTSSLSTKRRLNKDLYKLSQQTFCDSDSWGSESLDSEMLSWNESQTGDSLSVPSWRKEQPCLRCKAKRTREWLARHFFDPKCFPQEKHN